MISYIIGIFNVSIVILIIALAIVIYRDALKRNLGRSNIFAWTVGSLFLFPVVPLLYYIFKKRNALL